MTLYYFDHAASAPRRPEVLEAMAPFLVGVVGNPSGTHRAARAARRAIEESRDEVAAFVGASPHGVIFTGGGTESCHLALFGAVHRYRRHHATASIVTTPVEHHAILETAAALAHDDDAVRVRVVPVSSDGLIDVDSITAALGADVAVVSVMTANNETGVIEPVDEVARAVHESQPDALVHTDAVAAAPWIDLAVATANCDLVSLCAHKLGGPVNAGALVVRGDADVDAAVGGGGQEKGRRGGTVDVAAAVGLATALRLCAAERATSACQTRVRRDRLIAGLTACTGVTLTARGAERLPGHVHVTADGVASDEVLFLLDQRGVCASAASSCASGAGVASHVLAAMGVPAATARGAVRFTIGVETTDTDVAYVVDAFTAAVATLRERP